MSKTTPLSKVLRQSSILSCEKDSFWPIPDQYVGIEIEMEGYSNKEYKNHHANGSPYWTEHQDQSLRNGIEMVLTQPMMGNTLREAISYFFRTFTQYIPGPRTSIHVHLNMRQDNETLEGLKNMVVLYYILEDAYFIIAGESRKWNGYCNPFEDNPPRILEAFVRETDVDHLYMSLMDSAGTNSNRYYGMNLNALQRFGTIEFRHLPLVTEEGRLIEWVKLLMELKAAANRMADEGTSPARLFQSAADIDKLRTYMPMYGDLLLSHIDPITAYIRLININGLRLLRGETHMTVGSANKAWQRFQQAQEQSGTKAVKKRAEKSAKKGIDFDAITREMFRPTSTEEMTLSAILSTQATRRAAPRPPRPPGGAMTWNTGLSRLAEDNPGVPMATLDELAREISGEPGSLEISGGGPVQSDATSPPGGLMPPTRMRVDESTWVSAASGNNTTTNW